MNYASLFLLALLSTTTIHSMEKESPELVILDKYRFKTAIIYGIAPCLDRDDRTALKLTNNYFCNILTPQHILNEQYQLACATNNVEQMNELRRRGALTIQEEVYNLFLNNKPKLIIHIVPKHKPEIIRAIFFYGVEQDNDEFMQWLLDTKKPHHDSPLLEDACEYAEFREHYKTALVLGEYICDQKEKRINELKNDTEEISKLIDEVHIQNGILLSLLDQKNARRDTHPCIIS
jgi:hypothetical protein